MPTIFLIVSLNPEDESSDIIYKPFPSRLYNTISPSFNYSSLVLNSILSLGRLCLWWWVLCLCSHCKVSDNTWFMCPSAWLFIIHHIDQIPPNWLQISLLLNVLWTQSQSCLSRHGKHRPSGQQYSKEGMGFPYFMPLLVGSFIHP